jgi:phospholipase/lecithinase/hemolysin
MTGKQLRRVAWSVPAALALTIGARAASAYDAIYAFGDSLSDAGNNYALSGDKSPAAPYHNGEYSNGNVWLDTLATDLGLPALTPSQIGGTDYAYGGAASGPTVFNTGGSTDVMGATGQIAQFQATHPANKADPNALYTILIGGNDLLGIPSGATQAQGQTLLDDVVHNIDGAITTLAGEGAKNFLVLTVPDLGTTPAVVNTGAAANATAITAALNGELVGGNATSGVQSLAQLAAGAGAGVKINLFDTAALFDQIAANPASFGFSDVTDPCYDVTTKTVCANPNSYMFWDVLHPTAAGHVLIGNGAAAVLGAAPVPLPAAAWLLMSGLGGCALLARRRRLS